MCGARMLIQRRASKKSKFESHCQSSWIVGATGDELGLFPTMANCKAFGTWNAPMISSH